MLTAATRLGAARPDPIHRQQCLDQAARCRRLAYSVTDHQASSELLQLAAEYERSAWGRPLA